METGRVKGHGQRSVWVGGAGAVAAAALLAGGMTMGWGQEAVRMSLASSQAAEARRRAATSVGYYNLQLGPTSWRFSSGLGMQYDSNINLSEDHPLGDFIVGPQASTSMVWPVSEVNSLNLTLGGGYQFYVRNPSYDRAYINPDSELSFDLYVGDFWINLHDRFSISQYSYQDPTVSGSGNYSQFQNAVGATTTWDLNKVIVKFGYDHVNFDTITGGNNQTLGGQPSGYAEVFSTSAGYVLRPQMVLGLEVGGSLITYTGMTTNSLYSSATEWNVGGFYDAPLTEYIHVTGHAGYSVYSPESSVGTVPSSEVTGEYGELDITHRVNQYMSYALSGGRMVSLAYFGGTVDRYFAHWQANWQILQKVTLGTSFVYEHGSYTYAGGETYDQYGPGISLSRAVTAKLMSSLGYQLYWRDSNHPGANYTLHVVSLSLNYTF